MSAPWPKHSQPASSSSTPNPLNGADPMSQSSASSSRVPSDKTPSGAPYTSQAAVIEAVAAAQNGGRTANGDSPDSDNEGEDPLPAEEATVLCHLEKGDCIGEMNVMKALERDKKRYFWLTRFFFCFYLLFVFK